MKKRLEKINNLFFIILPFIDIITSITTRLFDLPVSLGIIIKGLYMILITTYIILYCKQKEKKHFLYYLGAILIYCILYIGTKRHLWNINNLLTDFIALYKYLFTGFILFAYIVLYKNKKSNDFITKIMYYTLICYTVLLIVPEITNTSFNSYWNKPKEGSVGWFYAANEISAIILMLFPFYFSKLKEKLSLKKYSYLLLIIPIIYSIYIIGTKTSWYGLLLISIVILIIYIIKERKDKKLILFSILLVASLLLLNFISPTNSNLNKSIENSTEIKNKENKSDKTNDKTDTETSNEADSYIGIETKDFSKCGDYHKLKEIIPNKTVTKSINVLLSGRENKAYTQLLIYKDTNISNKLFGTGFIDNKTINNCQIERYIEIDLFDAFVHYGIIGLLILIFPYVYLIKKTKLRNIKKLDSISLIYLFTFILLVGLSFVSGHILGYPTPSIYLNLLLILVINNINSIKNKNI